MIDQQNPICLNITGSAASVRTQLIALLALTEGSTTVVNNVSGGADVEALQAKIKDLETQLKTKDGNGDASEELDALRANFNELETQRSDEEKRRKKAEKDLKAAQEKVTALTTERDSLLATIAAAGESNQSSTKPDTTNDDVGSNDTGKGPVDRELVKTLARVLVVNDDAADALADLLEGAGAATVGKVADEKLDEVYAGMLKIQTKYKL